MDFFCANKMASGVFEDIWRAKHEYGFKNFPSRQVFEKKGVENPKNSVFGHFWNIVELNTDVLEPSLLLEIDNWSLLFKMSPKPNCLHAPLK